MRISVLLPLLIVLGGCSKPEPVDQKDQADQTVNMQSPKESLEDSIVGKVITLEMKEKEVQLQMMFNANGVMLVGPDGNLQDLGLTYKVDDHKVLVFEDGERDGGMLFSSSSPKVGDQVEMGPEDNKRNVTIIKIEQADQNLLKAKLSPADPAQGEASINSNLKYEVKDSAVTITGCDKKVSGELTIPVSIEGKSVTGIGKKAFSGCSSLTSITIPDSVTSIGYFAFTGCTGLTSITIPDGVTSIGERAFSKCSGLTSITIGNGVTSIGDDAFLNCTSLTSITIGNSVTSISYATFSGCSALTTIEVGAGNVNYTEVNGVLFNKEKTLLHTYPVGKTGANYVIPDNVTSIGDYTFYGCSSLTSITIGNSVTSIGEGAFGLTRLTSITIPDGVTSIGRQAFQQCASLTSITIGDSVISIGDYAFTNCTSLTSITIPDSVTSIGQGAFYVCKNLTSVTIGNSVTSIGEGAFGLTRLTSITIPDGVTSIGRQAFQQCASLTSITIPEGVTSIGTGAFSKCSGLTAVTFLGNAPKGWRGVFSKATPTIYRKPDAKGWGDTWGGRPVKLISEKP